MANLHNLHSGNQANLHRNNRRCVEPSASPAPLTPRYGWVFIPPPNTAAYRNPSTQQTNRPCFPNYMPNFHQSMRGILGPPTGRPLRPNYRQPGPPAAFFMGSQPPLAAHTPAGSNRGPPSTNLDSIVHGDVCVAAYPSPPWDWFPQEQPTTLSELFNLLSFDDPGNQG